MPEQPERTLNDSLAGRQPDVSREPIRRLDAEVERNGQVPPAGGGEEPGELRLLRPQSQAVEPRAAPDGIEQERDRDVTELAVHLAERDRQLQAADVDRAASQEKLLVLEDVPAADLMLS